MNEAQSVRAARAPHRTRARWRLAVAGVGLMMLPTSIAVAFAVLAITARVVVLSRTATLPMSGSCAMDRAARGPSGAGGRRHQRAHARSRPLRSAGAPARAPALRARADPRGERVRQVDDAARGPRRPRSPRTARDRDRPEGLPRVRSGSCELACATAGRPLRVWSPDGTERWNPLAAGNATELKDKLIATERFTEPHYQRAAERHLQLTITAHERAPRVPLTLERVVEMLEPRQAERAARAAAPPGRASGARLSRRR